MLGGQVWFGLVCMVIRVSRLVIQHHNVGQVVSMGQHGREGKVFRWTSIVRWVSWSGV